MIDDVVYLMQGTTADPASDLYVAANYKFNLVPNAVNDVAVEGSSANSTAAMGATSPLWPKSETSVRPAPSA